MELPYGSLREAVSVRTAKHTVVLRTAAKTRYPLSASQTGFENPPGYLESAKRLSTGLLSGPHGLFQSLLCHHIRSFAPPPVWRLWALPPQCRAVFTFATYTTVPRPPLPFPLATTQSRKNFTRTGITLSLAPLFPLSLSGWVPLQCSGLDTQSRSSRFWRLVRHVRSAGPTLLATAFTDVLKLRHFR